MRRSSQNTQSCYPSKANSFIDKAGNSKHSLTHGGKLRFLLVFFLSTLVTACDKHSEAKKAIANLTMDPSSVQWKDIKSIHLNGKTAICGKINAKNSYGGYVGFRSFMYLEGEKYFPGDLLESLDISACCHSLEVHSIEYRKFSQLKDLQGTCSTLKKDIF